jgi:hypothetical protein
MGGFFPLAPAPLYTIDIDCTNNIVLVYCTNKNEKKQQQKTTFFSLNGSSPLIFSYTKFVIMKVIFEKNK